MRTGRSLSPGWLLRFCDVLPQVVGDVLYVDNLVADASDDFIHEAVPLLSVCVGVAVVIQFDDVPRY